MAESLPDSSFLGIDLSELQIKQGNTTLKELGLKNIELQHLDIADVDDSLGKFDYIICHGVYSWVPKDVQQKILELGRKLLNENGIMYVSYNTYPGWHLRGAVRDMMQYHVAQFETPKEKIAQARELLKFLAESAKSRIEAYPTLLKQEAENLSTRSDSYLYHEFLEVVNEPVYFHEFVDRVTSSGLWYVSDAEVRTMMSQSFDEKTAGLLKNVPMLRREQYMDLLRSRMFRVSLLCQSETTPRYDVPATCLSPLHIGLAAPFSASKEADGSTKWTNDNGSMVTKSPMTDVLQQLNSTWPGWVSIEDLFEGPLSAAASDREQPLRELMMAMLHGVVRFAEQPPHVQTTLSQKPSCSGYTRWQASQEGSITNRSHSDLNLERLTRLVAENADGTNDLAALSQILQQAASDGKFRVTNNGETLDQQTPVDWTPVVQQELARLAAAGLLIS